MLRWLLVVVLVMLSAAEARAGELYSEIGLGPATVTGDLAGHLVSDGQVGGRIVFGKRMGDWAVDGVFFGTDLTPAAHPGDGTHSTLALGIDLRRFVQMVRHVELYARGGVDYTWLVQCASSALPPNGYSGRGYHYGAGLQLTWTYRLPRRTKVRYGRVQFFVDVARQVTRLEKTGAKTLGAHIDQVTFGLGFGFGY